MTTEDKPETSQPTKKSFYDTLAFKVGIIPVLIVASFATMYKLGQHSATKVRWYSELTEKTMGQKIYPINVNIRCMNGKDLGQLQVDLDLTNGKLRVVRNDPQNAPNCSK